MANNNNNNKKKKVNRNIGYGSLFGNVALVSIILLALAFLLSFVFGWIDAVKNVSGVIIKAATAVALLIAVAASYPTAKRKGRDWFIVWLIASIIVFVAYILGVSFKLF